jgi:uncharacterized protein (TIGR03545 family)
VNFASGKSMISGVFDTFIIQTLGSYYPYAEKGIAVLKGMQNGNRKAKPQTMKSKSGAIQRLAGRNFAFGSDPDPRILFKNIAFSVSDTATGISGSGRIQNLADDADRLGKPVSFSLDFTGGKMVDSLAGTVDVRSGAQKLVDTNFSVDGYQLSLDNSTQASVPSIQGTLGTKGTLVVLPDGTLQIGSSVVVSGAKATLAEFEPALLYSTYRDTLAGITRISLGLQANISAKNGVQLKIDSDLDSVLANAVKDQAGKQLEQFKAGIRREGEAYIAQEKQAYSAQIAQFTAVADKSNSALDDIKNYRKTLDAKKAEADKRITALVAEKAAPVQKAATQAADKAKNTAKDALKKLF